MAFLSANRSRRYAPPLAGIVAALLLVLGAADTPAQAQGFDPFNWFQQVFRPQRNYDEYGQQRPRLRPRPHVSRPRQIAHVPKKPAVPPTFFVAVMGDSLGEMLGQALTTAMGDRPEVGILREAKEDSGLVRNDFYDWPKTAHDLVAGGQKINVAVMMIGSNDHQTLHDASGSYDPGTPKYQEIYTARIAAICKTFRDAKIPLIWVGLPIMKSGRFSSEMQALNDLYRQTASQYGATYADIWEAFGDDRGQFSPYGPDVDGQVVRLRSLDGIHFTKAGALKLASFVEPQIRQILNADTAQDDATLAKIETTAPAGTNAPGKNAMGAPVKPAVGPVLPLTGPVLAPGGQLAAGTAATRATTASLVEQDFVDGKPPAPKPGRADDFSWPRREISFTPPSAKPDAVKGAPKMPPAETQSKTQSKTQAVSAPASP